MKTEDRIEKLRKELMKSKELHFEIPPGSGGKSWFEALEAVCQFIENRQEQNWKHLEIPLRSLQNAMRELDLGILHPGLAVKRQASRPPLPMAEQSLVLSAVLASEAAMREGMSPNNAFKAVARELQRAGIRKNAKLQTISSTTIKNWRARLNEGPGRMNWAVERYEALSEELARRPPSAGGWKRLLQDLPQNLRAFGVDLIKHRS